MNEKELISKAMSHLAHIRWSKKTKEEKAEVGRMLVEARMKKKREMEDLNNEKEH